MLIASRLLELSGRIGGPRLAHAIHLRRIERWKKFEPEYFLLDHFVDSTRAAIDVGANEGIYAGRLSQLCTAVHCFEPNPILASELRAKLGPSAKIYEAAASNRDGEIELRIPYRGECEAHGSATIEPLNMLSDATSSTAMPCKMLMIDDVISEPIGFMKIDVEGHELAVLEGATELISRDKPVLLIESERRHNPLAPENIFAFLLSRGYVGLFLERSILRPLEAYESSVHQKTENLTGAGPYVNNFIFLPK